jgi:NADP-dependent 3-hydroxy acid dehydrogenase YdfG
LADIGDFADITCGPIDHRTVIHQTVDCRETGHTARFCDGVLENLRRADPFVNAAGLIVPDQPLTVQDDVWQKTLDVNLTGTM